MINVDEHKKLLAQIKELEKNSINYFDVEKEFFLIDSNNLSQVRPRLYGYSIQRDGIYEDDNLTAEAVDGLDGRGCYVYIDVKDGQITIKQDLNGCWGIYLFRHGDYFALSNSFFRLLDHIKFKYPLTVNRDLCNYLLADELCSQAYSETAVNEIQLVDRSAVFQINIANKSLQIDLIDYKEGSVPLDSEEGIATLDRWVEFWGDVFRGVAQKTPFIEVDLSGGFDSRTTFLLVLNSGTDCNKIRINTVNAKAPGFEEDFGIASQIANHYGFKLNRQLPNQHFLNYSFSDSFNINTYSRQTFHKIHELYLNKKSVEKRYVFSGYTGETLRGHWHRLPQKFTEGELGKAKRYSCKLADEVNVSIEKIIKSSFRAVRNKYKIEDPNSENIPLYLYQENIARYHGGKLSLCRYFINVIVLVPALDPIIRTLRLAVEDCPDPKLMMALLFVRYESDLLNFPFDHNHSIAPETIEYAKKINERFPRRIKDVAEATRGGVFYLQPHDLQTEKILNLGLNNPTIPTYLLTSCLKAAFDSSRTFGLFTTYFDEEFYRYAIRNYKNNPHYDLIHVYAILGLTKVLESVEFSKRNFAPYRDIQRFLEQDFVKIHDTEQMPPKFKPYITARVDVRLKSEAVDGKVEIISLSDDKAELINIDHLIQKEGDRGYLIHSHAGELKIVAGATVSGKLSLRLRGMFVPHSTDKAKVIPYWIDYTKLTVNDKIIFDKLTHTCWSKFYTYTTDVKAGEKIKIQVEWLPHKSND